MSMTVLSSREFNQDQGKAKRAAQNGPVIITDRGKPSYVLLTYNEWESGRPQPKSLAEALAMPEEFWGNEEVQFDPPRSRELPREVNLD